jgi:hypothetical protein
LRGTREGIANVDGSPNTTRQYRGICGMSFGGWLAWWLHPTLRELPSFQSLW